MKVLRFLHLPGQNPPAIRDATLFFLCFSCFLGTGVRAQVLIHGIVSDTEGYPLPFATVAVNATTAGTCTDVDGFYELVLPASAESLTFIFMGYESSVRQVQEVDHGWLDVSLSEGIRLPKVVVTALGYRRFGCGGTSCGVIHHKTPFPKIGINQQTDLAQSTAYPNPFRTTINLRTDFWSANQLTVQLLSKLGQVVRRCTEQPVEVGEQHSSYAVSANLPAGPYFLRLSDGRGREVTKVIVKGDLAGVR